MFAGTIHPHTSSITDKERGLSSSIRLTTLQRPGTLIQIGHIILPLMYRIFTSVSQIAVLKTSI